MRSLREHSIKPVQVGVRWCRSTACWHILPSRPSLRTQWQARGWALARRTRSCRSRRCEHTLPQADDTGTPHRARAVHGLTALDNILAAPDSVYTHGGRQGCGHWLGTGTRSTKALRRPEENGAKEWAVWGKSGARRANITSNTRMLSSEEEWHGHGHGH